MKARALFVLLCTACGGGDDGVGPGATLRVTSVTPAPNATNVETGAPVTVTFDQAIDAASLTPSTFRVKLRGMPLPAVLSYDPATRAAQAVVPLLPDSTYEVEVTTGVRTPGGSTLSKSELSTFTTRKWQAATADTTDAVGFYSSIRAGSGRVHVTYSDAYDSWDFKYATCAASCSALANWQVARVDTEGSVGEHSSLAIDATGRLHASYSYSGNGDLKYATCATNCGSAQSWQKLTIDGELIAVGWFTSLALDTTGRIHVSYNDDSNGILRYATCLSSCTTLPSWQTAMVDPSPMGVQATSLGVAENGRVHIAYYDFANRDLEYATCATNCGVTASWTRATVDATDDVGLDASLVVERRGRVHIVYYDRINGDLKYATCAVACGTGTWQLGMVDASGDVGMFSALTVDREGRLHAAYHDNSGALKYGTCVADCATAGSWRSVIVDAPGVGLSPAIDVDASGRVHVSYYDSANANLKYIR